MRCLLLGGWHSALETSHGLHVRPVGRPCQRGAGGRRPGEPEALRRQKGILGQGGVLGSPGDSAGGHQGGGRALLLPRPRSLGLPGKSSYAAANAALDDFAATQSCTGAAVASLNYGPWGGSGMGADARLLSRFTRLGLGLLSPGDGLRALARGAAGPGGPRVCRGAGAGRGQAAGRPPPRPVGDGLSKPSCGGRGGADGDCGYCRWCHRRRESDFPDQGRLRGHRGCGG